MNLNHWLTENNVQPKWVISNQAFLINAMIKKLNFQEIAVSECKTMTPEDLAQNIVLGFRSCFTDIENTETFASSFKKQISLEESNYLLYSLLKKILKIILITSLPKQSL